MDFDLLFVYGTLKRGYHNHRLLAEAGAQFIQEDKAPGRLYGGYVPVVTPLPENKRAKLWVSGEVFLIDAPCLARCDRLESHPTGYTRTEVRLLSGLKAYIYYWLHPGYRVRDQDFIKSGVWTRPEQAISR